MERRSSTATSPNLPATKWIDKERRCVSTVGPIPDAEFVSSQDVAVTADNLRFRDPMSYSPFILDKLVDVTGYVEKDTFQTKCDDKSSFDHVTIRPTSSCILMLPVGRMVVPSTYSDYWSEQDHNHNTRPQALPDITEAEVDLGINLNNITAWEVKEAIRKLKNEQRLRVDAAGQKSEKSTKGDMEDTDKWEAITDAKGQET
ncbi:hypothetical protein Bbelb_036440 [Branchiostoma belcheri]|nr:hypothetical protein Bbelb_036440 [Branchiostoma belcheri]